MRHYSEFLSTLSPGEQSSVQEELENTLPELSGLPTILCTSTNSKDAEIVKAELQKTPDNKIVW